MRARKHCGEITPWNIFSLIVNVLEQIFTLSVQ